MRCECGDCRRCKKRAYDRARYLERREEVIARARAWYEENKDHKSEYDRAYRASKGEERLHAKWRESCARFGVPADDDASDYAAVLRRDPCSYCGGPGGCIDHVTAITAGGTTRWPNLTSACRSCNSSKNNRALLVWMAGR